MGWVGGYDQLCCPASPKLLLGLDLGLGCDKKAKFTWTARHQKHFDLIKERLCSGRVMVPYNGKKETRIYTDGGPEGKIT